MKMKKIRFVEVKSEIGAGTRGASMGPDAIKVAALDYGSSLFKKIDAVEVPNENQQLFESPGSLYAKRIKSVYTMLDRVANAVKNSLKGNEFPIVLAGDHSSAAGTISGIRAAYPKQRLGVIWIDAHADLHSPWTTPSGNMHGMPLAAVLGEDNAQNKMNKPDKETLERIVDVHYPDIKKTLLREALEAFFEMREVPGLKKKPSTSEFLDWLKLLMVEDLPPEALRSNEKTVVIPPLHGALLKNEQDVHLFERLAFLARRSN